MFKIRDKIVERINRELRELCVATKERIRVEPGKGLFNYKCFFNAVQEVKANPDLRVVEVLYVDEGYVILHYINRDVNTGVYIDNTLGYTAPNYCYYYLREIAPDQYMEIDNLFSMTRTYYRKKYLPWYALIFGITEAV